MKRFAKYACAAVLGTGLVMFGGMDTAAAARAPDLDSQRLSASLDHLADDPVLGRYAQAEQARARDTLQRLQLAGRKDRPHWLYLAERRVDLAYAAANLEDGQHKYDQLQREHDKIMLEASRQDAEHARRELERQRIQNMVAQEETQRLQLQGQSYAEQAEQARAEATQAMKLAESQTRAAALSRKQAELAEAAARTLRASMQNLSASSGPKGMQMTLGDTAFAPGQASLESGATRHLGKLVQFVQASPDKSVLIDGYTDSSGDAARNKTLSQQRAASVRDALVAAGVKASRITVAGHGEADPVADNNTASGRARNRRVVVILKGLLHLVAGRSLRAGDQLAAFDRVSCASMK